PVNFSLVSQARSLDEIDTIYVQFKAKNQCLDFLEKLPKVKFIITDSNDESLRMHLKNDMNTAAIIPKHFINEPFLLTIHNVHDNLLNHTRFALIEKKVPNLYIKTQVKALLSIRPKIDEVG